MKQEQATRFNLKDFHKHNKVVWVDNDEHNELPLRPAPTDQDFKREHMQYIARRLKNKEQERKGIQKQLGLSSSDSDSDAEPASRETQGDPKNRSRVQNSGKHEVSFSSKTSKDASEAELPVPEPKIKQKQMKNQERGEKQLLILVSEKGGDTWKETTFEMEEKKVQGGGHSIALYDMSKLKLILSGFKDNYRLKITWSGGQWIFAAGLAHHQHLNIPVCFFIFATLINKKVELMGRKLTPLPKLQVGDFPPMAKQSIMFGKLLKKSRVITRWNEVLGVVRKEGLYIFKKAGDKGDLLVPRGTINELWTRFEWVEQHLIVKLFQGNSKIELGIPFYDFKLVEGWLYQLYALKH